MGETKRGHLWLHAGLTSVAAMWGLVFVANRKMLNSIDAWQIVTLRFLLISVCFLVIFAVVPSTRPHLERRDYLFLLGCGLLAVPGSQLGVLQAQHYLTPPLVALLVTTGPAFGLILGALFLKERISARQVIGLLLAFAGVVTVILAGSKRTALTRPNPLGATLAIFSQFCWVSYTLLSKRISMRFKPITAVGVAIIAGTLTMAPFFPHAFEGVNDLSTRQVGWLFYLAIGGTVVPYLIWFFSLTILPASRTTAYMHGVPLFALLWSWVILSLVPKPVALLGGAVIIAGIALTQIAARRATP